MYRAPVYLKRAKGKGIALMSVLITVSIITTITSSLVYTHHIDIERTGKLLKHNQIWSIIFSLENMAKGALELDRLLNQHDGLQDEWLAYNGQVMPIVGLEDAFFTIELTDLQSVFNINNFTADKDKLPVIRLQFKSILDTTLDDLQNNYLDSTGIDYYSFDIPSAVDSVQDWVDSDTTSLAFGAEDDVYTSSDYVPYLAANTPMASVTELALVQGFETPTGKKVMHKLIHRALPVINKSTDADSDKETTGFSIANSFDDQETTSKLEPNGQLIVGSPNVPAVVALPFFTPINVNMADQAVLSAILGSVYDDYLAGQAAKQQSNNAGSNNANNTMDLRALAKQVIGDRTNRSDQAFISLQDFYDAVDSNDNNQQYNASFWERLLKDFTSIESNFFLLTSVVSIGELNIACRSILHRTKEDVVVIQRLLES